MKDGPLQVCVLSPHRDDAAFSCSLTLLALLCAGVRVHLVNVCTRSSYAPFLPDFHPRTLDVVSAVRAREDDAFVREMVAAAKVDSAHLQMTDLDWPDAPDRWHTEPDATLQPHPVRAGEVALLAKSLCRFAAMDLVLAPLAVGCHVDHCLVHSAALATVPVAKLLFYEDLPYAARLRCGPPTEVAGGEHCRRYPALPGSFTDTKLRFARCYPSQIEDATAQQIRNYAHAMGGRERFCGSASALDRIDEFLLA